MTTKPWGTLLPAAITPAIWAELQSRLVAEQRAFFAKAGLRFRIDGKRVRLRADPVDYVFALPLQRADRRLRADAQARLTRMTFGLGLAEIPARVYQQPGFDVSDLDRWSGLRMQWLQNPDPVGVAARLIDDQPSLTLIRRGGTDAAVNRHMARYIIEDLAAGIAPKDLKLGSERTETALVNGLTQIAPGSLVCAPLTARFQPLAALLLASTGAEVAAIPDAAYLRGFDMGGYPTGVGRASLQGLGQEAYRTKVKSLPPGHALSYLDDCLRGSNRLLNWLGDPATFADETGTLDLMEQAITAASVRFGVDAVNALAARWGDSDTIWSAFRALGTLQGVWEGFKQGSVPLRELLDPRRLRTNALPAIPNALEREHFSGLVDNYEQQLTNGFAGATLDESLKRMEELRHLVHGVGGQGKRDRDARLRALKLLAENAPNVQLVCDMAALWWTAVIMQPEELCRPGHAPWKP